MLTIEKLRAYGANVDDGLGRCMKNESFYLRLVNMALDDGGFARLRDSLAANDLDGAFEAAHALKGILGNLALTPIYAPTVELTDKLRSRAPGDYSELLRTVLEQRDKLAALAE